MDGAVSAAGEFESPDERVIPTDVRPTRVSGKLEDARLPEFSTYNVTL